MGVRSWDSSLQPLEGLIPAARLTQEAVALGSTVGTDTCISESCKHLAALSAPLLTHLPGELSRSQVLLKTEELHGHVSLLLQGRGPKKEKES